MKRKLIVFLIPLLLFGCKIKGPINTVEGSGTLEVWEHHIGPRVPGRIVSLSVDEGDWVKKGQLLATLERYDQTKRDYLRAKELIEKNAIPKTHYEKALLEFEDQQIIAPVDGIILKKIHETGEVLAAGTPVLIVGDPKKIWVRFFVPGSQINRVAIGQSATVTLDGLENRPFKGEVNYIAFKAEFTPRNIQTKEERVMQTFEVKVTLEPIDFLLRPGVPADVVVDVSSIQP